uniref:Uncharacterized protein n=1 Tax=viral metagenome TaxID=1070528 RepID=A0A6C0ACT0_9ZZZZ
MAARPSWFNGRAATLATISMSFEKEPMAEFSAVVLEVVKVVAEASRADMMKVKEERK